MGSGIKENIAGLRQAINDAAVRCGRDPSRITMIAVSKNVNIERIQEAVQEGIIDLGENRVQEFLIKQPQFGSEVHWHLIGHLQTNKVKSVVGKARLIHSVDSWRLAAEIDRLSKEIGSVSEVLIQVNVSGEESKYGLPVWEVTDFIKSCTAFSGISVRGLMTVAPLVDNAEEVRPVFRELKSIQCDLRQKMPSIRLDYLSMGMTNDFRVAVEEGANFLRIGTAIFGTRQD